MATTQTVKMFAPTGVGGLIQAPNGTYVVASDFTLSANAADVQFLLGLGFQFAITDQRSVMFLAPLSSNATVTVGSTSLTAGSLTIAAQPDQPRQLQAVVFPGGAITAGTLTFTYTANDGTTQVDALSLVMASQAAGVAGATLATTKGVQRLTSAVVASVTGGSTPGVQVGTNNFLAVPVPPRFVDFAPTYDKKATSATATFTDEAVPTVFSTAGALITPTTNPNSTLCFSLGYNVTYPG